MWLYLALSSAVILGFYDICKKISVQENAVIPVLFLTSLFGSLVIIPPAVLSITHPALMKSFDLYVPAVSLSIHFFIFIKSALVASSWILSYFTIKHLPLTVVVPIRASGPIFTLIGAIFLFQERPSLLQWAGFLIILISFFFMSKIGKLEGINFRRNPWIFGVIGATLLGACSGLYDKYLLQTIGLEPQLLLTWFSVYLVIILFFVTLLLWVPLKWSRKGTNFAPFKWRWSIPAVGILLFIADAFYFRALHHEEALVVIVSSVRKFRVFIAVIVGGLIFKENNKRKKNLALTGVMSGVLLILLAK